MAYNNDSFILSWIHDIPSNPPSPSRPHHRKRRHSDPEQLVSPPSSQEVRRADFAVGMSSIKRKRLATTPSLSRNEDGESDRPSTQPSPSKSLSALALTDGGVEVAPLEMSDQRIPRSLVRFSRKMSTGVGFVPKYLEAEIAKLREHDEESYADFEPHVFLDSDKAYSIQLAPEIELSAAQLIVNEAREAFQQQFDESGWNNSVHSPLLFLAFYGKKSSGGQLHVFQACNSAGILPTYLINNNQGKKVDYVCYIQPQNDSDPQTQDLINKIRSKLYDTSINHSNHASLRACPISVSVKTKKDGSNDDKALLQLAV
ncbi:hypothetical protein NW768_007501 [Fusarium equiseti]|uniref:PD-(D/E)XK nuclease-like domain-containing protein n=1 Tax=Fusarium equiseti TaxID=61235 RepID=A0ABQ8R7V8_FUSEQ|nr:hypothetical protein NW768_007501 [Fusarium equiseti]